MNLKNLFQLIQVLMAAGNNPLVQKFVDNMVKGTTTRVDDWVWGALKIVLCGGSINDVERELGAVQEKYDEDKEAAVQPAPTPDFVNV